MLLARLFGVAICFRFVWDVLPGRQKVGARRAVPNHYVTTPQRLAPPRRLPPCRERPKFIAIGVALEKFLPRCVEVAKWHFRRILEWVCDELASLDLLHRQSLQQMFMLDGEFAIIWKSVPGRVSPAALPCGCRSLW